MLHVVSVKWHIAPLCYIQIWWELQSKRWQEVWWPDNALDNLLCVTAVCLSCACIVFFCIYVGWAEVRIYCFENYPNGDSQHQSECWEAMSVLLECLSCFTHMGIFGLCFRLGLLDNCLNNASSCGPLGEREWKWCMATPLCYWLVSWEKIVLNTDSRKAYAAVETDNKPLTAFEKCVLKKKVDILKLIQKTSDFIATQM